MRSITSKYYFLGFLILCSFVLLFSCDLEENPDAGKKIVYEVVKDIDTTTFWNNTTVYIIRKKNFKVNHHLIIEAGAIIKFDKDSGRSITITDNGYITAQGSISKPVIFTSIKDDFYGGDNNKDKNGSKPGSGDWDGIIINGKSVSTFSMCNFTYGGGGSSKCTIETSDSVSIEISDCVFAYNNGGTLLNGQGVVNLNNTLTSSRIKRNIFYGNNLPIQISTSFSLGSTNYFYNTKNISETNTFNVIAIDSKKPVTSKIIWEEDEIAFYVRDEKLIIGPFASLVLGNGATLKFAKGSILELNDGKGSLLNYDGPEVALTSIFDDNIKGDSNGDKGDTNPSNSDWFISIGSDSASFNWETVFYATYLK